MAAQLVNVFNATGNEQNWTVSAGVNQAHFDVRGPDGGNKVYVFGIPVGNTPGGKGGRTVAEIRAMLGGVIHIPRRRQGR